MDFDIRFIKIGLKIWKLCAFEYLQMDCNGGGHIVGLVTSHSLIKYA